MKKVLFFSVFVALIIVVALALYFKLDVISTSTLIFSIIAVLVSFIGLYYSRQDQACTILFDLLDEYKTIELHEAIKVFLKEKQQYEKKYDKEYQKKILYDKEFHERIECSPKSEEDPKKNVSRGLNDQYRLLLYFWRKVALVYKMEYVNKKGIFAAFHNMEVLDILSPTYWGYCTFLQQDKTMDDHLEELRKAYYKFVGDTVTVIEKPTREKYEKENSAEGKKAEGEGKKK